MTNAIIRSSHLEMINFDAVFYNKGLIMMLSQHSAGSHSNYRLYRCFVKFLHSFWINMTPLRNASYCRPIYMQNKCFDIVDLRYTVKLFIDLLENKKYTVRLNCLRLF